MKKLALLFPVAALLCNCSTGTNDEVAGGPGSETTNGIVAMVGGSPATFAGVALRKVDYTVGEFAPENAMVQPDVYANENGNFELNVDGSGDFRLTVVHGGNAYTQVLTSSEVSGLDTVVLEPTGSVTGAVTVPEGSDFVWVGVMGMDVMVKTDVNGVFALPQLPATDSLKLYFVKDGDSKLFKQASVKPQSYGNQVVDVQDPAKEPVDDGNVKFVAMVDGAPAAYAKASLRAPDFKVKKAVEDRAVVNAEYTADADGKFSFARPDSGSFRLTVTQGGNVYSKVLTAKEIAGLETVNLEVAASMGGNVSLSFGNAFAWVGVFGLDVLVKTDNMGEFILPTLPAEDTLELYFFDSMYDNLYVTEKVFLKPSSQQVAPVMTLEDFENDIDSWYFSVDTLGSTRTPTDVAKAIENDTDRKSKVFHGKYSMVKDDYAWVLAGTTLKNSVWNLSKLDSIEFYAKGDGKIRISFENWDIITEGLGTSLKASSSWNDLDSKSWTRYVFTPADLCLTAMEQYDCKASWNATKSFVRQIHFFSANGGEFYIDDIKLYGALF